MKLPYFITAYLLIVLCMSKSAYAESKNTKIIESLRNRLERNPNNFALRYNLGTIYYQDEAYDKAQENLNHALALATPSLRANSAYNLGNTLYRIGQSMEGGSLQEAIRSYDQAREQYELVLQENPSDEDARHNYELVNQRLEWLKEQQQQSQSDDSSSDQFESQSESSQGDSQQQDHQSSQQQSSDSTQGNGDLADYQPDGEDSQQLSQSETGDEQTSGADGSVSNGEESGGQRASKGSNGTGEFAEQLSREQALWILDSIRREEAGSFLNYQMGNAQQRTVERDW